MIHVEGLTKTYPGKPPVTALSGVTFGVAEGERVALLGVNGAGKTTTLRVLSTMLRATDGVARVGGVDVRENPSAVRRSIGFLSAGTALYGRLTGLQGLRYFAALYDLEKAAAEGRIAELDDRLKLSGYWDRPAEKLSTGQRQRLSIARAVLHDPPVLFFDEPTSGLDVISAQAVLEFMEDVSATGKTLVFSTHTMSEVSRVCTRAVVLGGGTVVFDGPVAELAGTSSLEEGFLRAVGYERGAVL